MAGPRYRREIAQYRGTQTSSAALKDLASTTGKIPVGWVPSVAKMGLASRDGALGRQTEVEGVRLHIRTARLKFIMSHETPDAARSQGDTTVPMMCAWMRGTSEDEAVTGAAKQQLCWQMFGSADKAARTLEGQRHAVLGSAQDNPYTGYLIRHKVRWYQPSSIPWECDAQISNVYLNEGEFLFAGVFPLYGLTIAASSTYELPWGMETDVRFRLQSRADISRRR